MSAAARLGPQHFAYLRAWVEGVDQAEAARRYLDLAHGHALANLHAQVVDQLRALARRRGDTRWRLVGIDVGTKGRAPLPADRPPLDLWAAEHGVADFSYDEQLLAYEEAFPVDVGAERRRRRNARLRERQLQVLADLEPVAAVAAKESDPVDAWLSPGLAAPLQRAGYATLGDLARAMRRGDRWYATLKGIGVGKARRVVDQLARLLGPGSTSHAGTPLGSTRLPVASGAATSIARTLRGESGAELDGSHGSNRAERRPTIAAANDRQAIEGWLKAIAARSPSTNASYRKEAERWLLWCLLERRKALSSANVDDCLAYMAFLQRIPEAWQSRRLAKRLEAGWTPFRGPLAIQSRRYAVKVVSRLCAWLTDKARYLDFNPWSAVDRRLVEGDELPDAPASKALTKSAYACLLKGLPDPTRPGATRNGFILVFGRYTGLRATELRSANVGALERSDLGWRLYVVGKGRKPRYVSVPSPAIAALEQHLAARGLPALSACPKTAPLLATAADAMMRPTYSAVHQSFTAFVRRALRAADLPVDEQLRMQQATQHWLRHTFATRSAEAEVPPDVLQAELGHRDPATTAAYYTAAQRRRQDAMERAALAV
jgi:integrase